MTACVLVLLAASAAPLELDEVIASAQAHHPLVWAALYEREAAEAELVAARGAFDPSLKVSAIATPLGPYVNGRGQAMVEVPTPLWGTTVAAGYRLSRGEVPPYYGERLTDPNGELRASVTVPLWRNGPTDRRRANITKAGAQAQAAEQSQEQQRLDIRRAATVRWARWVAAGQRAQLARGLLELARVRQEQLEHRTGAGDLPRVDALDNQRAILQREALLLSAERGLQEAALELSLFVRDGNGAPQVAPPERLPVLASLASPSRAAPPSLDEALARRPELARFEAQLRGARAELALQQNQLWPAIDLQAAVSRDLGPGFDPKLTPTELEVGVYLDIPLWYRLPSGRIDAAQAQVSRLAAQAQLQRERVRVEVADALSALTTARERAGLLARELELARSLESLERERLALGDATLFMVNLRESSTFETAQRQLEAWLDWQRAEADLQAALAEP